MKKIKPGLNVSDQLVAYATRFLCLRLLEKRRHYVIGLSERVKECKSVNATGIPNGILSKGDANPRLIEISAIVFPDQDNGDNTVNDVFRC